jgi:flagellar basal-body rod modification protein FlgD
MASSILPVTTPNPVTSAVTSATATGSATASAVGVDAKTIASNFTSFLQLLTTQLKNQNPLDPLDTNQFTAQLVQFAQVEQQLKSNDQLATLVSLQKVTQSTAALEFVGQTVAVDGATAPLTDGQAVWNLSVPKPAVATINITSASGQTVFSGNFNLNAGQSPFVWDGRDNNGQQWPDGNYTISVNAQDSNRQPVSVPTEIKAPVDSVDLTQSPPLLSIAGQQYTMDKIKRVVRSGGT